VRIILCAVIIFFSIQVKGHDSTYHFVTSDGVSLYLRTAGKGFPCLFIHGGPGNTSHYFEPLPAAKLLEQQVCMIYYDQRGGGRSASAKDSNYCIKRMEQDIEEIRNYLKIKKWSIIGHSFGGLIMTAYARDYPANIQSLVYLHCSLNLNSVLHSHIENGIRLLKEIGVPYEPDSELPLFNQMMNVHAEMAKHGIEYKIMFRSAREKNIEDSLIGSAAAHFNQDFQRFVWKMNDYQIDYAIYTKDIICPVLIITGKKDYAVGPDTYKTWYFKNSEVIFYDYAHASFQEDPKWFAEHVLSFLKSTNNISVATSGVC
jgi:proline iminopeptidase